MKAAVSVLNDLESAELLEGYAIGGAMAAMFYAEPVATFDLDVFIVLPAGEGGLLTLSPLYDALRQRGYEPDREHVVIEGVPVQFLPAYNPLLEEALEEARTIDLEGIPARVLSLEHLIAVAVQTGRPKDRERVRMLTDQASVDRHRLADICGRHNLALPPPNVEDEWTPKP